MDIRQRPTIEVVAAKAGADPLDDLRREGLQNSTAVGMAELRAAAVLVAEGMAERVTLACFPSWPGLLTEIERLSRELDLSIQTGIGRGGGRVDIFVSPAERDGD